MSERATRPLNQDACKAADDDLYSKHADDPRPNALYDENGNRKPLDPNDPSQAGLRQEWMDSYKANGGATEPTDVSGSQPGQAVLPCGQMQQVDPVIDSAPVDVDESDAEPPEPEEEAEPDEEEALSDEQVITDDEEESAADEGSPDDDGSGGSA